MASHSKPSVIDIDEGFTVEMIGRAGLRYSEGMRRLNVDSELLTGGKVALITTSIVRWRFPFGFFRINERDRVRILDNIRRALRSRQLEVELL